MTLKDVEIEWKKAVSKMLEGIISASKYRHTHLTATERLIGALKGYDIYKIEISSGL